MFNSLTLAGSQKIDLKKNQLHKEADNNSLLLSLWRKRFVGEPTYISLWDFPILRKCFNQTDSGFLGYFVRVSLQIFER